MHRNKRRSQHPSIRKPGNSFLPPEVHRLFLQAVAHHQAKRFSQAEDQYNRILTQFPSHADTLHLRGLLAYQQGQNSLALTYIKQAIAEDSGKPHYPYNLGLVFEKEERWEEAIAAYQQALIVNPQYVEALANLGNVYRRQRQWIDAVTTLQQALQLKPQSADLHNALGVTYKEQGERENALRHYQQALQLSPHHAEALNNMGVVLQDQGQLDKAAEAFQKALTVKPEYANAHYHLGLIRLWQGKESQALAGFHRSGDLTHNHGHGVAPLFVTKARVKHDFEQLQYLTAQVSSRSISNDYRHALTNVYQRLSQSSPDSMFMKLSVQEQSQLAPSFNRLLYIRPTSRLDGYAINPQLDVSAIETEYFSTTPEVMSVDGLLTEKALSEIRAFCLESTIWKRDYPNGYIGTFLANGFACPLLLQIAEELRTRFPKIFQHYQLQQAWAFKHDSALRGLNMHADAAAVNVNFWITPNEANRNPESGGLVVWNKEAPDDWDFVEYNNDKNKHKIQTFLEESGAQPINIPHRQNRAVIFNSNLFHQTDIIEFQDIYECRRINITLLYGHRQQSRQSGATRQTKKDERRVLKKND
ncbi:MAG TPA: tetratricopeptide repeat protein [Nitrospirales bacterium]|nr:tetratricopeptide repeat protein [Nitrospirales bacterium]